MNFSSKLLENAVNEMAQLPGIGKRTALRLVLHLLKQPKENTKYLAEALSVLRNDVKACKKCYNISDTILCEICANPNKVIRNIYPSRHPKTKPALTNHLKHD